MKKCEKKIREKIEKKLGKKSNRKKSEKNRKKIEKNRGKNCTFWKKIESKTILALGSCSLLIFCTLIVGVLIRTVSLHSRRLKKYKHCKKTYSFPTRSFKSRSDIAHSYQVSFVTYLKHLIFHQVDYSIFNCAGRDWYSTAPLF